jgi:hypothetical protein
MTDMRGAKRVLIGNPEGMRPHGRSRSRWENNIKMDRREMFRAVVGYIHLAQGPVAGFVNTVNVL